jgi:hypothetical protein
MERETGIEPATFSLGMWRSIENKEHGVHPISFWQLRIREFLKTPFFRTRIEQKWSRRVSQSAGNRQLMGKHLRRLGQM